MAQRYLRRQKTYSASELQNARRTGGRNLGADAQSAAPQDLSLPYHSYYLQRMLMRSNSHDVNQPGTVDMEDIQLARLGMRTTQHRAWLAQIGQVQGNYYLANVLASAPPRPGNLISRWGGAAHKEMTREVGESLSIGSMAVRALEKASIGMDWRVRRLLAAGWRYAFEKPIFTIKAEGVRHGEGGWYELDMDAAKNANVAAQEVYLGKAVEAYRDYVAGTQGKRAVRIPSKALEDMYEHLGDALHVAQDRGAHGEGARGFGHGDPRVKEGYDPDDPQQNAAGFRAALENTYMVLSEFLARTGLHGPQQQHKGLQRFIARMYNRISHRYSVVKKQIIDDPAAQAELGDCAQDMILAYGLLEKADASKEELIKAREHLQWASASLSGAEHLIGRSRRTAAVQRLKLSPAAKPQPMKERGSTTPLIPEIVARLATWFTNDQPGKPGELARNPALRRVLLTLYARMGDLWSLIPPGAIVWVDEKGSIDFVPKDMNAFRMALIGRRYTSSYFAKAEDNLWGLREPTLPEAGLHIRGKKDGKVNVHVDLHPPSWTGFSHWFFDSFIRGRTHTPETLQAGVERLGIYIPVLYEQRIHGELTALLGRLASKGKGHPEAQAEIDEGLGCLRQAGALLWNKPSTSQEELRQASWFLGLAGACASGVAHSSRAKQGGRR